jgi:hypothetical protein
MYLYVCVCIDEHICVFARACVRLRVRVYIRMYNETKREECVHVYAERVGGRERGRDTDRYVDKSVEWLKQGCGKKTRINDSSRDDRDH